MPAIFGVSLIFLGTWFLLNLMLAVIMHEYIRGEQEHAEVERQRTLAEKQELEERIQQQQQSQEMLEFQRIASLCDKR